MRSKPPKPLPKLPCSGQIQNPPFVPIPKPTKRKSQPKHTPRIKFAKLYAIPLTPEGDRLLIDLLSQVPHFDYRHINVVKKAIKERPSIQAELYRLWWRHEE